MKLRQAVAADQAIVEQTLQQAAERIKETGSQQWSQILKGAENEIIRQRISQGEVIIYEETLANGVVKTVGLCYLYHSLTEWDQTLWQSETCETYFYLHRLALADGYTGQGMAHRLLRDLQLALSQRKGDCYIRLDCIASKPILNNLYQSSQFKQVGQIKAVQSDPFRADFNLYECSVKTAAALA